MTKSEKYSKELEKAGLAIEIVKAFDFEHQKKFKQKDNVSNPIYEWEYYDENLQKDIKMSKNIQEEIQSYASECDYKQMINQGIEPSNQTRQGIYIDITNIQQKGGLNAYMAELRKTIEKELNEAPSTKLEPKKEEKPTEQPKPKEDNK